MKALDVKFLLASLGASRAPKAQAPGGGGGGLWACLSFPVFLSFPGRARVQPSSLKKVKY